MPPKMPTSYTCRNGTVLYPQPNRVLVMQEDAVRKTKAGLLMPDTAVLGKPGRGIVLATGWRAALKAPLPAIGDLVIFNLGLELLVIEGDEHLTMVRPLDILAVVVRNAEVQPGEPSPGFFRKLTPSEMEG